MYPKRLDPAETTVYHENELFAKYNNKQVHSYAHTEATTGMHSHDFYELIIILDKSGCHYIGDMQIPTTAGDVFVIPPGVEHGYYYPEKLDVFYILFHSSFMEKYYNTLFSIPGFSALFEIEPYLRQVYEKHLFLHLNKSELEKFKEKIADILKYNQPQYAEYQTLCILHFIGELSLAMQKQSEKSQIASNDQNDILKVLEYIQEHYSQKITVSDLMKISNMSRATLHRHFKSVTQTTPMEYILNLKLNAVHNRLPQHTKTKAELAQEYGFYDASHLNKYLKDKKDRL